MAEDRKIRDDEAALWNHVAREVVPLSARDLAGRENDDGRLGLKDNQEKKPSGAKPTCKAITGNQGVQLPDLDPRILSGVDKRTAKRLKQGKIRIEARMDLHGKTQAQAHAALGSFIRLSYESGRRCVLVITGKGSVASGEGGILRQMTPRWLNEPRLRTHIIAISQAQQKDGGSGALYVLLKRGVAG